MEERNVISCPRCKEVNSTDSPFCPNCGAKMDGTGNSSVDAAGSFVGSIANKINSLTGGEEPVELRMRDLFSEVFKSHTRKEAENLFACGSETTTPKPEYISKEWPKPWYFTRVFGFLLLATILLYFMYITFINLKLIPGLIFVSAMVGVIPVLFFYFECNSPRNIDIMTVMEIFFIGGILSLLFTLGIGQVFPGGVGDLVPSMITGIVEEIGKVAATAYFVNKLSDKRYIFNGLLIGGAVGAGFAVFETAGYIFNEMLLNTEYGEVVIFNPNPAAPLQLAMLRGFLGFGGHVAWAAITGAGIMMVLKKHTEFSWSVIFTEESLRFLILVIVLHGVWDMSISQSSSVEYIKWGSLWAPLKTTFSISKYVIIILSRR